MSTRRVRVLLAGALWAAPVVLALNAARAEAVKPGPLVGKPAPAFQVQGIFSESLSLDTFKGHILVMQFGASW